MTDGLIPVTSPLQTSHPPSPVAPATGKKVYAGRKFQAGTLFLTANAHKRTPVFRERALCDIFFRELDFYRTKYEFKLYAYALLPDHFHLLLRFPPEKNLGDFLRDFKSALGRLIVDWAKANGRHRLLSWLKLNTPPTRRKDARYRALQENSHVKLVDSDKLFSQKLDYIHANALREGLVERAIDYPYSSLRNYELGKGCIPIDPPE